MENLTLGRFGLKDECGYLDPAELKQILKGGQFDDRSFFLPTGTLLFNQRSENNYTLILESEPMRRTIRHDEKEFFLEFPYMMFVLPLQREKRKDDDLYYISSYSAILLASRERIASIEDDVNIPVITNVHGGGTVCWGAASRYMATAMKLHEMSQVWSFFFDSKFHYRDWPDPINTISDVRKYFSDWEKKGVDGLRLKPRGKLKDYLSGRRPYY